MQTLLAILVLSCASALTVEPMPANLKLAFVGDHAVGASKDVFTMLVNEKVDAVISGGDFDYQSNPALWLSHIDEYLGDTPFFFAIGNHDQAAWWGEGGYKERLMKRHERTGTKDNCEGEPGINEVCSYKGFVWVNSGVGTEGNGHEEFIDVALERYPSIWRMCNWHKNQRLYQIGGKSNEVGYRAYDTCRRHGAIVATAHEHSYARTWPMTHFENFEVESHDGWSVHNPMVIAPGQSMVWCSGLGGASIRVCKDDLEKNPWWASYGCEQTKVSVGAVICVFNHNGVPNRAHCEFKFANGIVWDSFWLQSNNTDSKH